MITLKIIASAFTLVSGLGMAFSRPIESQKDRILGICAVMDVLVVIIIWNL